MSGSTKRAIADIPALKHFATEFRSKYPQGAIVSLKGDLGAGKTTFVREFLASIYESKGLAVPRVISPSYVLHQRYGNIDPIIHHFDLYRLENVGVQDLIELGILDAIDEARNRHGFVFIEWAEKITAPRSEVAFDNEITFELQADGSRSVSA